MTTRADLVSEALKLDREDPLAPFRERFSLPRVAGAGHGEIIYFNGNSLGLQPLATKAATLAELDTWGMAATSKETAGWRGVEERRQSIEKHLSEAGAAVLGAAPAEVAFMNGLTVNLHLLLNAFYRPTSRRFKIVMEQGAFSSDQYAVASQCRMHGVDPAAAIVTVGPRAGADSIAHEDILAALQRAGPELALVLFGGVHYVTGQLFDIKAIAAAARAVAPQCFVGFDLAHAAGNVQLQLHDWGVDFAAFCTYKYLNAGPGGLGGIFVHEQHLGGGGAAAAAAGGGAGAARGGAAGAASSRAPINRMAGWWGHDPATRFDMPPTFEPIPHSAYSFAPSNPPPPMLASALVGLQLTAEAGMAAVSAKAARLSAFLEKAVLALVGAARIEVLTPAAPWRGAQLSLRVKGDGAAAAMPLAELAAALQKRGIVCDTRRPDVLRVAPAPLYNTFDECVRFAAALAGILASNEPAQKGARSALVSSGERVKVCVPLSAGDSIQFKFGFDSGMDADEVAEQDIGFEARFIGTDFSNFNKEDVLTEWARVKPKMWPQGLGGRYTVTAPGKVQLLFDNSYSWIKSKAITYRCHVKPAVPAMRPLVFAGPSGAGKVGQTRRSLPRQPPRPARPPARSPARPPPLR